LGAVPSTSLHAVRDRKSSLQALDLSIIKGGRGGERRRGGGEGSGRGGGSEGEREVRAAGGEGSEGEREVRAAGGEGRGAKGLGGGRRLLGLEVRRDLRLGLLHHRGALRNQPGTSADQPGAWDGGVMWSPLPCARATKAERSPSQCSDLLSEVHRSHRWKVHRNHRNGVPWHPLPWETAGHSYAVL
jgi:hypothetical protein